MRSANADDDDAPRRGALSWETRQLDRFPRHMTGRRRCGSSGLKDGLRPTVRGVWTLTINIASKLGHIVRVRKEHYRSGDTL
jgi:hypothetical protein